MTHCRNFPIRDSDRAPNKFFLAAVFLVRPKYTRFAGSSELERPLTVCSALLLQRRLFRVFLLCTAAAPSSLFAPSLVQDPSDRLTLVSRSAAVLERS